MQQFQINVENYLKNDYFVVEYYAVGYLDSVPFWQCICFLFIISIYKNTIMCNVIMIKIDALTKVNK